MFCSSSLSVTPLATLVYAAFGFADAVFGFFVVVCLLVVVCCAFVMFWGDNSDQRLGGGVGGCILVVFIVMVANCGGWLGWLSQPSYMPDWTWYVANSSDSTNAQPAPPTSTPQPQSPTNAPPPPPSKGTPEQLKTSLEAKIKDLESKKNAYEKVMGETEKEKEDIVENLKKLDVKSSADLKGKPKAQRYAERLTQVVHELDLVQKRRDECEEAIDTGRFKLRSFERLLTLRRAGISDDELSDVSTIIARLDEKLKSGTDSNAPNPLKVEAVLEKELKAP